MAQTREHLLVDTFVALADYLVSDFDLVDLLQLLVERSVKLFDAAAAGILLANARQELEVIAASSERSEFIGLLQLHAGEGPCVEAFATGSVVSAVDPAETRRRWPRFAAASAESGYTAVHSVPLRLRDTTLGSLNLFMEQRGPLNDDDAVAAQALADVVTISILQQRSSDQAAMVQKQLRRALDSRVVIEQAKGFLARNLDVDVDTAFQRLRDHARRNQLRLAHVAKAVIAHEIQL